MGTDVEESKDTLCARVRRCPGADIGVPDRSPSRARRRRRAAGMARLLNTGGSMRNCRLSAGTCFVRDSSVDVTGVKVGR